MIFVISNRNITNRNDEGLYGDDFNQVGQDLVSAAEATNDSGQWRLRRIPDTPGIHPVKDVCNTLMDANEPWVLFVHGYNESQADNLAKAKEIEEYGVNVLCFSWPSNPGPNWWIFVGREYKKARFNARRSTLALELTLAALDEALKQRPVNKPMPPVTLVVHSLGNTLLQHVVMSQEFDGEGRLFKNVLLHQADVANNIHAEWVSRLSDYSRVYVTLNENDIVLDAANIMETNRLGNTLSNLSARGAYYLNFTNANAVGQAHRLWAAPAAINQTVYSIFQKVLTGGRGENVVSGTYDPNRNVYEVP